MPTVNTASAEFAPEQQTESEGQYVNGIWYNPATWGEAQRKKEFSQALAVIVGVIILLYVIYKTVRK